jgi:hexosaminidase
MMMIPKPLKFEQRIGDFFISASTLVLCGDDFNLVEKHFLSAINARIGGKIKTTLKVGEASVKFEKGVNFETEEYEIDIKTNGMTVRYGEKGLVNALVTLNQLFCLHLSGNAPFVSAHACYVSDKPKYAYRGILLDVSRHFFSVDEVKKLLSSMAMFKLNILHLHLTDNQGWRVEIRKYPALTTVGATRNATQSKAWGKPHVMDNRTHSGFYTQNDIREIVHFARELNITVVPEFDMPAHCRPVLAAYPHLSCNGEPCEITGSYSFKEQCKIACLAKKAVYDFTFDVLNELCMLFPSPYFHIGGDEVYKKAYCDECKKATQEKNFFNEIAAYLNKNGKRLIGWNEILKTETDSQKIDKNAIVQYWTPYRDKRAENEFKNGRDIIMSKHQAFYFDMPYALRPLKNTYNFNPKHFGIVNEGKSILGVEGTAWTEWIANVKRLNFQLFPRVLALAENAWTSDELLNYNDFLLRAKANLTVLDAKGINYAPLVAWDTKSIKTTVKFFKSNAHCEFEKMVSR